MGYSLPYEVKAARAKAYLENGRNISATARATGVNRSALGQQIHMIIRDHPELIPPDATPHYATGARAVIPASAPIRPAFDQVSAPQLPEDDEDLETTVNRMAAEQRRREAYTAAATWMRFTVDGDKPFALVFVGDPHIDQCDIIKLREDIAVIERTPRMWACGLGDWTNGWVGKLRGQYAFSTVTEKQGYKLAEWLLNRTGLWWLIIWGNHDGQRWHGESSPLKWMQNAAAVPGQEWAAKFSIACGEHVWRVSAAHNFPGHSMYNVGHGPKKRALMTGAEADIFVAGDRHTFTLAQDQHEHTGKLFWTLRARGYKPLDHYALEHGYGDAGGAAGIGHSVVAVFDPRDGSIVCFGEVRKGAAYLRAIMDGVTA